MLTVAGIGPGHPKYLTKEVYDLIKDSDKILAFRRAAEGLKALNPNIIAIDRVQEIVDYSEKEDYILLASGDPNFYGIVDYLRRENIEIKKVLPGLSSFQYMMARLEKSWNDAELISLHGREGDLARVKDSSLSIILTDKDQNPNYISKELDKMGVKGKLYTGYDLSYKREKIFENKIGDDIELISPLAIVVIENEMD